MATLEHAHFDPLLRAAIAGDLPLMECLDVQTREARSVLAPLVIRVGRSCWTPFGDLAPADPHEAKVQPAADGALVTE